MILELKGEERGTRGTAGLEVLMDEVAEISAWCSCVGIPMLSVYEQTGMVLRYGRIMAILILTRYSEGLHSYNSSDGH